MYSKGIFYLDSSLFHRTRDWGSNKCGDNWAWTQYADSKEIIPNNARPKIHIVAPWGSTTSSVLNSFKQEDCNFVDWDEVKMINNTNNFLDSNYNQSDFHSGYQHPVTIKNEWEEHEKLIRRQNDLIKALSKEAEQFRSKSLNANYHRISLI